MSEVYRLVLGTAQWGLPHYGIANQTGKPGPDAVEAMLDLARQAGVRWLDTAAAYGDAEAILGQQRLSWHFRLVTKMAPNILDPIRDDHAIEERIVQDIQASIKRLGRLPDGYLFHSARYALRSQMMFALAEATERMEIGLWGVSCYEPDEALSAMRLGATAIQVPLNAFDRRMVEAGVLMEAERRAVTVFARAPYLQGLLVLPPEQLPPDLERAALPLAQFWVRASGNPAGFALSAALQAGPHRVVVGCETLAQCAHTISMAARPIPGAFEFVRTLEVPDGAIVNPSLWAPKAAAV